MRIMNNRKKPRRGAIVQILFCGFVSSAICRKGDGRWGWGWVKGEEKGGVRNFMPIPISRKVKELRDLEGIDSSHESL